MSSRRAAVGAVVVALLAGLVGVLVGSKVPSGTGAADRVSRRWLGRPIQWFSGMCLMWRWRMRS